MVLDQYRERRWLLVSFAQAEGKGGISRLTGDLLAGVASHTKCRIVAPLPGPGSDASRLYRLNSVLRLVASFVRLSRRWVPDVVHATTWRAAIAPLVLRRFFGYRLVVHALGAELTRGGAWNRVVSRWVLSNADLTIAISHFTRGLVKVRAPTSRCVAIPPGLPSSRIRLLEAAREHRDGDREVRLLTVASLHARKGHFEVVNAVAQLRERGLPVHLEIVGGGPDELALRSFVEELGLDCCVQLRGKVPEEELVAAYGRSDIFVMFTQDSMAELEGFGIVFLEAAAAGLQILSGPSGGAPELVDMGLGGKVCLDAMQLRSALESLTISIMESGERTSGRTVPDRYRNEVVGAQIVSLMFGEGG